MFWVQLWEGPFCLRGALIRAQLVSVSLLPFQPGFHPPQTWSEAWAVVFIILVIGGNKRARVNHSRGMNR